MSRNRLTFSSFIKYYGVTILITSLLLVSLSQSGSFGKYADIGFVAIPIFSLLSFGVYVLTEKWIKQNKERNRFNIIIYNVLLKFIATAFIIGFYYVWKKPEDGSFVVPFIIIYLAFTIFETFFMSRQAKV